MGTKYNLKSEDKIVLTLQYDSSGLGLSYRSFEIFALKPNSKW